MRRPVCFSPPRPSGEHYPWGATLRCIVVPAVQFFYIAATTGILSWDWDAPFNCCAIKGRIPIPTQKSTAQLHPDNRQEPTPNIGPALRWPDPTG